MRTYGFTRSAFCMLLLFTIRRRLKVKQNENGSRTLHRETHRFYGRATPYNSLTLLREFRVYKTILARAQKNYVEGFSSRKKK